MKENKAEDRRRFFRINDAIGVTYEVIGGSPNKTPTESEQAEENININQLLEHHNVAIASALSNLEVQQPEAAKAISEVNKKLDALLTLFELEDLTGYNRYQQFEQASISACGLAFPVTETLAVNTSLKLNLFLQPSGHEVLAVGRVVGCQPADADSYFLRVEFTEITEADRERLIQHIVQRQSTLLKSLREQMEADE